MFNKLQKEVTDIDSLGQIMQTVKDISDLQNRQKFEFENLN